nr:putative ribonuclease H-like domain-containing protein [Tanacetum cinerariifolium]
MALRPLATLFLKKTKRKVGINGSETIGFDQIKVECYNCHKKGHFARECRAPRENRNREPVRRNVIVKTTDAKALMAQDGFSESVTSMPAVATNKAKTRESKPKSVSEPFIEDWISDREDENETETKSKQRKPIFAKEKGVIDSGCSKHMTGDMSYLSEYEEIDGGYVAFGGDPKGATKDETSGILKAFITRIENLINHKVKIIRCDNETKFKNKEINLFCKKQGIKREFSVARTPQHNVVAERKKKTIIEAARTMLADSKLPTTFWAEAVNTGNQYNSSASKARVETIPEKDYILLPLWTQIPLFSSSSKDSLGDEFKPLREEEKKDAEDLVNEDNEVLSTEEPRVNQEKDANVNNTYNINNVKEIVYSDDDEDVGAKADMTNLDTNIPISLVLTTRIHKDHPVEQMIRDIHSTPQTRRMTKSVTNHDVKSAFLYVKIEEDVYFYQPSGFEDPEFPDRVHKKDDGIFISQEKYVDEILKKFCFLTVKTTSTHMETTKPLMKDKNAKDVDVYLYISMIGSLMYLTSLRLDIIFAICACARFQVTLKVSHLYAVKRIFIYLKGQPKLGLWYPKDSPFDLEAYTNSEYVDASLDRKSTTRGCQFLRSRLISWQCKKQTVVANSTTEANTICIVKNLVFHSKTTHIEIRHHFIRDSYEKRLIQVIKIHTNHNVADLLTKALDVSRFHYLIASIGMLNL